MPKPRRSPYTDAQIVAFIRRFQVFNVAELRQRFQTTTKRIRRLIAQDGGRPSVPGCAETLRSLRRATRLVDPAYPRLGRP